MFHNFTSQPEFPEFLGKMENAPSYMRYARCAKLQVQVVKVENVEVARFLGSRLKS